MPHHTLTQCCWTTLKSGVRTPWPHGCLPSPLPKGRKRRGCSQHGQNAGSLTHSGCHRVGRSTGMRCGARVGSTGPGDHILPPIWERNQPAPGLQEAPTWCSQCCEPGRAASHGGSWSVPKGRREMFSSPGYLVHLYSSLCSLQCDGVGLLQPLGHSFLEPLVEIAQSQRSIPVDEGTSFSNRTATVRGHLLSVLSHTRNCPAAEAAHSTVLRGNLPLAGS